MSDYRKNVLRTCPNMDKEPIEQKLGLGALGLAGETGEVVDLIKKILHHGKLLDRHKLINEMGDVRWYLEYLAITLDVTMEEIEAANVAKLKARFPDGFSFEAANAKRDETKEPSSVTAASISALSELTKDSANLVPKVEKFYTAFKFSDPMYADLHCTHHYLGELGPKTLAAIIDATDDYIDGAPIWPRDLFSEIAWFGPESARVRVLRSSTEPDRFEYFWGLRNSLEWIRPSDYPFAPHITTDKFNAVSGNFDVFGIYSNKGFKREWKKEP